MMLPSGELTQLLKMAIEIVDFPIKNGDFPLQNVSSPEGIQKTIRDGIRPFICLADESAVSLRPARRWTRSWRCAERGLIGTGGREGPKPNLQWSFRSFFWCVPWVYGKYHWKYPMGNIWEIYGNIWKYMANIPLGLWKYMDIYHKYHWIYLIIKYPNILSINKLSFYGTWKIPWVSLK